MGGRFYIAVNLIDQIVCSLGEGKVQSLLLVDY